MAREPKPIGEYTNKDWKNLVIYVAFFGIFVALLGGVYLKDLDVVWIGIAFFLIAVVAGFMLHFFFGIKIIDLRRDFKNKKF